MPYIHFSIQSLDESFPGLWRLIRDMGNVLKGDRKPHMTEEMNFFQGNWGIGPRAYHVGKGRYTVRHTLKQTGFPAWDARKSAPAMMVTVRSSGRELGPRKAQGRGPQAQLERPLLFCPSPAFPRALGVSGVGSRSLRQITLLSNYSPPFKAQAV